MKDLVRKKILALRQKLSPWEVQEKSLKIFRKLIEREDYNKSSNIMLYMPFRGEVDTMPIICHCLENSKKVIIPIAQKESKTLLLSELKAPEKELAPGTYGILEPLPQFIRPFPKENLDLILVPAVAFDLKGFRLGYGAGYYDRFLASLPAKVLTIGMAFELQIVEEIPVEATDLPVDYVITENQFINCLHNRSGIK
jgi:5-formyltetrahydrofolate cyclo-ligase